MRISVVIPALNEEKYIERTLKSISEQNPYEIIVVDNGSTDKTAEIASKYAKVIKEPEKGVAKARDTGWRIAKGDIIAFTDADTVVGKNWINEIENSLKGDAVAVYGPVYLLDGNIFENFLAKYGFTLFLLINHYLISPHFSGQNFAVKRRALESIDGFNTKLKTAEDVDLSRRLHKKFKNKIIFNKNLKVYTSARRLKAGYLKFFAHHTKNYLRMLIFKRSEDYKIVR